MKTIFKKFGKHSLKGALLPDGRFIPDFQDATRILCTILGVPQSVLDTMPEVVSPLDAADGFWLLVDETKDRPETIAFEEWLDSLTRSEEGYSGSAVVDIFQHFGREITQDEIYQTLTDDPDNTVVADGDTTRIYNKDGELLAERRKL